MLKEEAKLIIKAQPWKENPIFDTMTAYRVDLPAYAKLCDALSLLSMGFYTDTLGFNKKEAEKFRNVNVCQYQFLRGDIPMHELEVEKYVPPQVVED